MSDQSRMSYQMNFDDFASATSLPESEDGRSPSEWPDGPKSGPSGPDRALANLSARQAKEKGLLTSGTFGRRGSTSSTSFALTRSLVSRLRTVTAKSGSTLFRLTWKESATPSGWRFYRLLASVRRTGVTGFSSWPTPNAGPQNDTDSKWEERRNECKARHQNGNGFGMTLGMACQLATWPTAKARDTRGVNTPEHLAKKRANGHGCSELVDTVQLASWSTPSARDWKDTPGMATTAVNPDGSDRTRLDQLPRQAILASWPTPTGQGNIQVAGEYATNGTTLAGAANLALWTTEDGPARLTATGEMLTGSSAGMDSGGPLDPAHSRWEMGYPPGWCESAVTAMRSYRPLRRPSSGRSSKAE